MTTKDITLNKSFRFRVKHDEYVKIEHPSYQNLSILDLFGFHERLVSLIEEISYVFPNKVNISMSNVTHGGYLPVKCSEFFKIVYTHYTSDHELTIPYNIKTQNIQNIQKLSIPNEWIDINFDNPSHNIILSSDPNLSFPNVTTHIYQLSNVGTKWVPHPTIYVYVADTVHETFVKRFHLEIVDNVLTYDNLLHLCVMVKNGGEQFEEMLSKNRDICDRWTILDTGSTDNTLSVIHDTLVGKKRGNLVEEPFINFRDSRNRCLDLAGKACKFIIMMDDTYTIQGNLREFLQNVRGDQFADSFSVYILSDDTKYGSNRIIKSSTGLRYMYRIHEVISDKNNINVVIPSTDALILDRRFNYMEERTMKRKELDLLLLYEELEEDPSNPRTYYYLAQTYNLLKNYQKAYDYFIKRSEFTNSGFIQERVDAVFEAARLANFQLKKPWKECLALYEKCYKIDESRPESLYFIGVHYYTEGDYYKAYSYFKKGFEIGFPNHCQYSLKPTLSYHFLPKFLTKVCYEMGDYVTGEEASALFLKNNSPTSDSYQEILSWHLIFKKLNISKNALKITIPEKPILCFVADGGFAPWSGSNILKNGVGGSETYIIEMARHIQRNGHFQVIVFCNCPETEIFEGVQYRHLDEYPGFINETYVHTCIVSRFTEYLPVAFKGLAENVYLVLHDLGPSGSVIPIDAKLKNVFCLTEWHVSYFLQNFPALKNITVPFYYGIDTFKFKATPFTTKNKYQFIYSSFPNRGLLPLLQMWPKILQIQPLSSLHIYSDVNGKWVNEVAPDQMSEIRRLLEFYKNMNITYHGWVDKKTLAKAWLVSDIWFYPCIFMETFCLTALEAALSKTLVITNNLAGLQNTVCDRGIVIPINNVQDVMTHDWQQSAISAMTPYLTGNTDETDKLVSKNYEWASHLSWEQRSGELLADYILKYQYQYKGMYNWTNDLPRGGKSIFLGMIDYFNKTFNKNKYSNKHVPRVLEIGSYTGTSLIEILNNIPGSVGTAIDQWKKYNETKALESMDELKIEDSFYHNIDKAGLKGRVSVSKGDSAFVLMDMIKKDKKFDFIYVDGSHLALDCYLDMTLSYQLLEKGGMMVVDDYIYNLNNKLDSPYEGVNQFLKKYEGTYQLLNKGYRVFLMKNI